MVIGEEKINMSDTNFYNPAATMALHEINLAQREANLVLQRTIQEAGEDIISATKNLAEHVAQCIYNEVIKYQATLSANNDVAMMLTTFGGVTTLLVNHIGYIGDNLIVFYGTDNLGKPLELIQHIHQLNFLLQAEPVQQPLPQKRTIGFGAR